MGNSWIIYDNSCSKENTQSVKTAEYLRERIHYVKKFFFTYL